MLLADLVSLHLVTFLMLFILVVFIHCMTNRHFLMDSHLPHTVCMYLRVQRRTHLDLQGLRLKHRMEWKWTRKHTGFPSSISCSRVGFTMTTPNPNRPANDHQ